MSVLKLSFRYITSKALFKKHCLEYFMAVISTLCFGGKATPEPALIIMLVEVLYSEDYKLISFLVDKKLLSGVRSSLLQLLMEHR